MVSNKTVLTFPSGIGRGPRCIAAFARFVLADYLVPVGARCVPMGACRGPMGLVGPTGGWMESAS